MAIEKYLSPSDVNFLTLNTLGTWFAIDGLLTNPSIVAAFVTLVSTVITVGFNIYKLYRDDKKEHEETPPPIPRIRRKKRHKNK